MVPTDTDRFNRATRSIAKNPFSYALHAAAQPRPSAASAAPLVTTRVTLPVSSTRAERWKMRTVLNEVSSLKRLRKCGRVPVRQLVSLKASTDNSSCGYGGLVTCGSVWACPVCSGKISSVRRTEVGQVCEIAVKSNNFVSMLTLTQRHNKSQTLSELWESLSYAWARVTSGRRWQDFKDQLGMIGYIRAVEVTHGQNGWHAHIHALIISEKDPSITPIFYRRKQGRRKEPYALEIIMPSAFIADRWKAGLAKKNVDFIANRGGLDWRVAKPGDARKIGQYVAKMGGSNIDSIASEATLGQFKKARRDNRTPFQILADFIETGYADDLALWHLWEKESHGKRALTWSKGLRDWAKLEREKTDEEIAEEDLQGETIATFNHDNWKLLRNAGAGILLDVLQSQGRRAAYLWLIDNGVEFSVPEFEPDRPPDSD